jgi:nucleoside 2-deoxyribosyltransferase
MEATQNRRIYCSGPLFCPEEVAGMTAIAERLEKAGYATFLPHRDGLEAYLLKYVNDPRVNFIRVPPANRFLSRAAFALDIYQILERCDALVMNMNGRVHPVPGRVDSRERAGGLGLWGESLEVPEHPEFLLNP